MVAEARSWGALHDELGKETKTNPMGKAKALYSELAPSGASATGTGVLAETQRQVVEGGESFAMGPGEGSGVSDGLGKLEASWGELGCPAGLVSRTRLLLSGWS